MRLFTALLLLALPIGLAADVPAKYQRCTFKFQLDKQNNITGKPAFLCE